MKQIVFEKVSKITYLVKLRNTHVVFMPPVCRKDVSESRYTCIVYNAVMVSADKVCTHVHYRRGSENHAFCSKSFFYASELYGINRRAIAAATALY